MDYSGTRTSRMGSIASTSSDLSRTSSLQPSVSRHSVASLPPSECPLSPEDKALIGLPDTEDDADLPPSYEDSTRQTFVADRSRKIDLYGNEWRCRLGVWYMVPSGRKSSTAGPSSPPPPPSPSSSSSSSKDWRKKFGVWYSAPRQ